LVVRLSKDFSFVISPPLPFNFDATVHKPSHFPTPIFSYSKGIIVQSTVMNGQQYGLILRDTSSKDSTHVEVTVYSHHSMDKKSREKAKNEICYRYQLQEDISSFSQEFVNDDLLGPVLERLRGMRLSSGYSLYELAVVTLVLQNATIRRTTTMLGALLDNFGQVVKFRNHQLPIFWMPSSIAKVSESRLREIGLGYRARFLSSISKAFTNDIEHQLREVPKEKASEVLLGLHGIGPVSCQILLCEGLKHYDAFDVLPLFEQKVFSRLLFNRDLVDKEDILDFACSHFGKWRALAMHYLWEDLFRRRKVESIAWLDRLIRL